MKSNPPLHPNGGRPRSEPRQKPMHPKFDVSCTRRQTHSTQRPRIPTNLVILSDRSAAKGVEGSAVVLRGAAFDRAPASEGYGLQPVHRAPQNRAGLPPLREGLRPEKCRVPHPFAFFWRMGGKPRTQKSNPAPAPKQRQARVSTPAKTHPPTPNPMCRARGASHVQAKEGAPRL